MENQIIKSRKPQPTLESIQASLELIQKTLESLVDYLAEKFYNIDDADQKIRKDVAKHKHEIWEYIDKRAEAVKYESTVPLKKVNIKIDNFADFVHENRGLTESQHRRIKKFPVFKSRFPPPEST